MLGKRPVKNVLLIESDPQEVRKIGEMFTEQGSYSFELTRSECMADAEAYLAIHSVDVILLLDPSGLDRLSRTHVARHSSIVLL